MINATQIKAGQILRLDNVIYRVLKVAHLTPGRGNAQVQADLRNLKTGIKTNMRFRPMDSVDQVETNAVFKVPMFIKPGDVIVINTETGGYIEKG